MRISLVRFPNSLCSQEGREPDLVYGKTSNHLTPTESFHDWGRGFTSHLREKFWDFSGFGMAPGNSFFVVSELVLEKIGTGKSLGTGIGIIWYRNWFSEKIARQPVAVLPSWPPQNYPIKIWYAMKNLENFKNTNTDSIMCVQIACNGGEIRDPNCQKGQWIRKCLLYAYISADMYNSEYRHRRQKLISWIFSKRREQHWSKFLKFQYWTLATSAREIIGTASAVGNSSCCQLLAI